MVKRRHIAMSGLDIGRQQFAAIIRSSGAGAGEPVIGAPLVFDELREPCEIGMGIEDYMVRDTDGEQGAFGNAVDGDRQIAQLMQLIELGEITVGFIESLADNGLPLSLQIMDRHIEEVFIPEGFQFGDGVLIAEDYGAITAGVMLIGARSPGGIHHLGALRLHLDCMANLVVVSGEHSEKVFHPAQPLSSLAGRLQVSLISSTVILPP